MTPDHVLLVEWSVWAFSWLVASRWHGRAVHRAPFHQELTYRVLAAAGAVLLLVLDPRHFGKQIVLWHTGPALGWALCAVVLLGFLFTWWARIRLGRLWSGSVTRRVDHRVVDSGPYGIVRHPIYAGIILAAIAAAAIRGTGLALAGAALLALSLYVKARLEETFLRHELGEPYERYAARVGMLVPFAPRARAAERS